LNLPEDIKTALRGGKIARASARALLAFNDPAKQRQVYESILAGGVSSRDVETAAAVNKPRMKKPRLSEGKFIELERNLADTLGTHVSIQGAVASGGRIVIKFSDLSHLNKIAKTIVD